VPLDASPKTKKAPSNCRVERLHNSLKELYHFEDYLQRGIEEIFHVRRSILNASKTFPSGTGLPTRLTLLRSI
jgi:hypothetical protein